MSNTKNTLSFNNSLQENPGEMLFKSIDFVQNSPVRYQLEDDEVFVIKNYRLIK